MDPSKRLLLEKRAKRTYELGRLRVATRVAVLLIPIVALAIAFGDRPQHCACIGVLILAGAIGLRWYGQGWDRIIVPAIVVGSVPMAAGLLRTQYPVNAEIACALMCTIGIAGGVFFAFVTQRSIGAALRGWSVGIAIAAATASLGCAGGGMEGLVGMVVGLTLATSIRVVRDRPKPTQSRNADTF